MKTILTILALFFIQISLSQDVELLVQENRTYIKYYKSNGDYKYKPTNKYLVYTDNRKLFVFNFVDKNYKVEIVGRKSKELRVYANRTILYVKGITLINNSFKLKLTEYKN